jgi:RNA polymerase sigma-70 factor (ECF subfamily)
MPTTDTAASYESDLVTRLRAGDEDAYEHLVRTHTAAMAAVARRYLGDSDDAADAVQDALVSAYRSMPSFGGTAKLGTWLHRITVNACLMKLRGLKRNRLRAFDEGCQPPAPVTSDPFERSELVDQVRACIDRLPPAYRTVIRLRDIDGMDVEQAADHLGTNVGALKVRHFRARQALRTLLAFLADDHPN